MEKQVFQCEYCGTIHELEQGVCNVPLVYDRLCPTCKMQGFVFRKVDTLHDTTTLFQNVVNKLKVQFEMAHKETYVPAKCRKERIHDTHTRYEYSVQKCTKDKLIPLFNVNYLPEYNGVYYLYKGRLYKQANVRDLVAYGDYTNKLPMHTWLAFIKRRVQQRCYESYAVGVTEWNNFFDKWLVVGDTLYHEVVMPVYSINTFGLGGNHGGTGFMVSLIGRYDRRRKDYAHCFYPHEYVKAHQYALQVANNRGDTESVSRFEQNNTPAIQILNEEVYKKYVHIQ